MAARRKPTPPALAFQDDTALQGPGAVRDRLIAQMKRQGAKNVRINAIYGRIKAEGYGKLDEEVNALRAAGIQPQVTIMSTPSYMPQADATLSKMTTDPRVWQGFANEVAKHFKGRVGRYSIGNEMNLEGFFAPNVGGARAGGRAYRNIYRGGYAGVKSADPTAQVLMGELVGAKDTREFLRGVLGGKKPIRTAGLAYHPYDASVTDAPAANRNAWDINNLPDLQATLARYKRQGKLQTAKGSAAPLYLTEFGYFRGGKLSDAERLKRLGRAYTLAKQAGARQMLYYQLAPTVRKQVQAPPTASPEGGLIPGAVTQDPSWVWDTSIADPGGNIPVINRGMNLNTHSPVARAARARKKAR